MLKIHKWLILAWFIMFAAIIVMVYQIQSMPKIGVVDNQAVVAIFAQKLVNSYPNKELSKHELQKLAENIKEKVIKYAKEHNLILLAKGAVWGGELVDFSAHIIELLDPGAYNAN